MWIFLILATALVVGLLPNPTPRRDRRVMLCVTVVVVGFIAVKDRLG